MINSPAPGGPMQGREFRRRKNYVRCQVTFRTGGASPTDRSPARAAAAQPQMLRPLASSAPAVPTAHKPLFRDGRPVRRVGICLRAADRGRSCAKSRPANGRRVPLDVHAFGSLVFFGQLGNGDLFGHPVLPKRVRDDVFVWDHEDDSRNWYAPDVSHALSRFFAAAVDPDSVSD